MQQESSAFKLAQKHRKISRLALRRRDSLEGADSICEQRAHFQEYIKTNVQSQRKNLLELYSNTIVNTQDTNESKSQLESNRMSPLKRSEQKLRFQSCKHSQKLMALKVNHQQAEQNLINSTKLIIRPNQHKNFFDRFRWKSTEVQKPYETIPAEIVPQATREKSPRKITKAPLPALPLLKTRSSKNKCSKKMSLQNQIDPWEYLVIAEQPDIFNL